jgi:TP901 family phage tail tape measure protein
MNIVVRVVANRAQAVFARLRGEIAGVNAQAMASNRIDPMGRRHLTSLMKFGNQLQWTGRMIQYNFTLPLAIAAGAATKWQLENEKAFVHVQKVYGDTGDAAKQFRKENSKLTQQMAENKAARIFASELDALKESFIAISNYYGVAQKEVLEVAGAWAAAGASGKNLAKSVDATMQAIIIGDMDAAQATKALISIQAQYNLSSGELMDTLASLNSVENATGASMQDLIVAYEKSAGVARTAGVTTQQLAAYVAALVPASGSAATAGNALKTIFSRLISPTKETVQVLEEMGLNMDDMSWKSASASEQLQIMSDKFQGLSDKQKNVVSTVAASRWQVNRFDILMRELNNDLGFHAKALNASEDAGQNFRRMQKELNTVLESDPRRLQRMWVMLQYASAEIIQPLIPYIIYLAQTVANLANRFAQLDPELQKIIMFGLVFVALLGPVIRYIGALNTLFGVLGFATHAVFKGFGRLLGMFMIFGTTTNEAGDAVRKLGTRFMDLISGFLSSFKKMLGLLPKLFLQTIPTMVIGWVKGLGSMLIAFGGFRAKLALLWAMTASQSATIWGRMWVILKALSIRGFVSLTAMSMIAPVVAVFTRMRALLVLIWAGQWMALKTAAIVAWAQLHAVAIGGSVAQVGIFSKMRTAVIVIFTTMSTAVRGILAGMASTMVVLAAGAATGFVGAIKAIVPFLLRFGKYLISWPAAVVLGMLAIFYSFRTQITQVWNNIIAYFASADISRVFERMGDNIISVFNRLPQGVQNAMIAVVTIVRDAALAVYNWFSYLNPFAHHSPSLVENVEKGVDRINAKFRQLGSVKGIISSVYAEIKRFSNATKNLNIGATQLEVKEDRKAIKKAGGGGAALASYDRMQKMLKTLNPLLAQTEARIAAQERVVARWQQKLDDANKALEKQQDKLQRLQDKLSKYQDLLSESQSRLDYFASAPLQGMRDMENQIFANTMAQKKLQYEMMQMEKVTGTFENLQEKMAAVNGLQEILRGTQTDLRSAGAGSEILGQYDAEIAKLEEQKGTYTDTFDKLNDMRLELERLQQQAEELDLVKALKFDELQHQIDLTADRTKELSFDEIIAGIKTAQGDVDKYTEKVALATAAVEAQEGVVAEAEAARDRIQARLDQEQATLDNIRQRYDDIKNAIDAINQAISEVVSNAEKMNAALEAKKDAAKAKAEAAKAKTKKGASGSEEYVSPGLQNFRDAAGANLPDVGGSGMPPRTDWSSQAKEIEAWTKKKNEELAKLTGDMFGDINPFNTLKEKGKAAWDWIVEKAKVARDRIVDFFSTIFDGVDLGGGVKKVKGSFEGIVEFITGVGKSIGNFLGAAWDLLGPDIIKIGKGIWNGLKDIWERVGPELAKFKELWGPIGDAINNAWLDIKPVLALIGGAILAVIKIGLSIVGELIDPVFDLLGDLITGIVKIVRGVVEIIAGIFNGDLPMILDGVKDLFSGLWDIIWGIFKAGVRLVWNVVEGFVQGIVNFFKWLYDVIVGHSIIPDLINGVVDWFHKLGDLPQWVWDHMLKPVWDFFVDAKDKVVKNVSQWWGDIKDAWSNIKDSVKSWWLDNVWNPVKDGISSWWDGRLRVWGGWWGDIKDAWNNIVTNIKSWWHDNIWAKVAEGISTWWDNRLIVWASWWDAIKSAWSNITGNIKSWWHDNIWAPVAEGIGTWWGNRIADFTGWWAALKGAWSNIQENVGDWWENNITNPIFNKVTGVWTRISEWFAKSPNLLKDAIRPMVNGAISAVNKIINGLNSVSDHLPGIEFHIEPIDTFAQGGMPKRRANRGFMTNGARAIVGEGKANYPEFVIPTDPTYRSRARSLLVAAANRLGATSSGIGNRTGGEIGDLGRIAAGGKAREQWMGTPLYAGGGILDDLKDAIGDLAESGTDWVVNKGKDMVSFLIKPFLSGAHKLVDGIDWSFLRNIGNYGLDKVESWVKAGDAAYEAGYDAASGGPGIRNALEWARGQVGKPYKWGGVGPDGYDCSGFMSALTNVIRGENPYHRVGATGSFPWPGFVGGPAVGKGFTIGSSPNYAGSGIGHMAGTLGGVSVESAGGVGVRVGGSARGYTDPGFSQIAHLRLAGGAIVRRRSGGTTFVATMGEGGNDEAIVPLPKSYKDGFGSTYNFYGDLSFPNIKSADDADEFIRNIQNLARD